MSEIYILIKGQKNILYEGQHKHLIRDMTKNTADGV